MYTLISSAKLDKNGITDYLSYTVKISQLAERYQWETVLLYDREYRRLQAALNGQLRWGADSSHLVSVYLKDKSGQNKEKPNKGPKGINSKTPAVKDPKSGKDICRNYNNSKCEYGDKCFRAHVCLTCYKTHPLLEHSKNA